MHPDKYDGEVSVWLQGLKIRHEVSLGYAKEAAAHCEREIAMLNSTSRSHASKKKTLKLLKVLNEKKELLAISYYDMAKEFEYLQDLEKALEAYEKSLKVMDYQDPKNEGLYHKIQMAKTLL